MGLLLAGLLAAFNSTFAGTLNAAQAYIVNDIYLRYIKPEASNNQVKNMNYITGIVVVIVSIIFGVFAQDVNSLLQWIVSALYGSYVVSNVLLQSGFMHLRFQRDLEFLNSMRSLFLHSGHFLGGKILRSL